MHTATKLLLWFGGCLLFFPATIALAKNNKKIDILEAINARLHGRVLDFTHNHGGDRRIWSNALCQRRDLYVYVPPCYDPHTLYPLLLYLHGFTQDEQMFLEKQIELFDRAIAAGKMVPCIIAWPDGSIKGEPSVKDSASFFANTCAGNFEDFVIQDVYPFVQAHFPIRPEREAHVITGASMGGAAAFTLAFKYPELFKTVVGFMPAVNLRWQDCRGRALGNFQPDCWGWRTRYRPNEVIGRFYGILNVRIKTLADPLFGRGPQVIDGLSQINPIELLSAYNICPGLLDMYIAYGGHDEFNVDAQVESFLYCAKRRGLDIAVGYEPKGKHDLKTGAKLFDPAIDWLYPLMAPYGPIRPEHGSTVNRAIKGTTETPRHREKIIEK